MKYILQSTSELNAPSTVRAILKSGLSSDLQRVALRSLTIPSEASSAILARRFVVEGNNVVVEVDEMDAKSEAKRRRDVLAEHENHLRRIFFDSFCATFEANSVPAEGRTYDYLEKVQQIASRAWAIVWDQLTQGRTQAGQIPVLAHTLCLFHLSDQ